jgi:2-polyprenyl-3-methyl-5-hydroxy-6-metoxy-1,4-benzoquinol methylase
MFVTRAALGSMRYRLADVLRRLRLLADHEVRHHARVIRNPRPGRTPLQVECDRVFVDRLESNPVALRLAAWEDHFEWHALLERYPQLAGHLLDFGCGSGHSDVLLARRGRHIHGVDLSPMGIAIAEYYRSREPAEVRERLSFELRDITLPNDTGRLFDSCWSSHVFEHIADPGPLLAGLRRHLKPDAPILVSVPFENAFDDPGHVNHFYSAAELAAFLAPHLAVERVDIDRDHGVARALCRNRG